MDEDAEEPEAELDESVEPVDSFAAALSPPDGEAPSPLSFVAPPEESSLPFFEEAPELELERRSILAQPEPLNMIVGGAKALRTGPLPQFGQLSGPWPSTRCTTSKRWPHAAHA